jgi:hypothetical protein
MFNKNSKIIKELLLQAYSDNMEYYGRLYIKAKQTIDHLEGQEFANAWEEMRWEFQRKCADDAIKMIADKSAGSSERTATYYKTREVPGVTGQTEFLIQYMYPDYVYCVLYYILTGKKASLYAAVSIDSEIKHMMNTWIRMWESNYKVHEPLYMGRFKSPMEY